MPRFLPVTSSHAPAHLTALPPPTRRFVRCSYRRASLRLLWLRSVRSAGLRYRKPTRTRPAPVSRPALSPLPGHTGPKKALRHPSAPPTIRGGPQAEKIPPPTLQCLRSGHAGQRIRPASRRFLLGSAPSPRHHALASARSSSSGSAAARWSAATPSQGPLRGESIGGLTADPLTPWPRHPGFVQVPVPGVARQPGRG